MRLNQIKEKYVLLLIMLVCAAFIFICIKKGHNWGGDFSLYIAQAKSINNSSVHRLYELNKYSMDHSIRDIGPYLYPFGFPVLLSPVYYLFGINFIVMKWFCSLFFLFSLPLIFKLFRKEFQNSFYVFFIIVIIAFNAEFITFCDNILSDFPFLFFSLLSILLMKRENTIFNQLILGMGVYFSYFIRDIGIVLVPTLMLFHFYLFVTQRSAIKNKVYYLIPYFVFGLFFISASLLLPMGGQNHYSMLAEHLSIEQIRENIFYYSELLSIFFAGTFSFLALLPFILLIISGMHATWRETFYLHAYIILTLAVLLIWPASQGLRFLFPVLPFLLFFMLKGFLFLFEKFRLPQLYFIFLLIIYAGFSIPQNLKSVIAFSKKESNQCYTPETIQIYSYISKNIPRSETVGFVKPAVLRLFTDVNSIYIDEAHFAASPATYFLTDKNTGTDTTNRYPVVYESENYILVKKQ